MDSIDIFLYFSYALTIVATIASIAFPLVNAAGDPKSLIKSGAGVGALVVIFLVGWLISGNDYTAYQASEFGITAGLSKFVGGLLIMMYILTGIAVVGIIYTAFSKYTR